LFERYAKGGEDPRLKPSKERDALIEKIREIESTLELDQFLKSGDRK
jgi:hypothetical protein